MVEACERTLRVRVLEGPLLDRDFPALAAFGPLPEAGDEVLVNLLGPEMGLGTGGVAVVLPAGDGEAAPENRDHFVKLPYTPLQHAAPPPEEREDLVGVPVVVLPLHSHLAPACLAAAELLPEGRVAFVWQEGGALPVRFSEVARVLVDGGLLHAVVSSGACFGGDVEAPNVYSALLSAAGSPVGADLVLCGIGPGVVGTGSAHGHGGMSAAMALNAASSLGASPVLAPRVSSADGRARHRGFSHHTVSALRAALAGCRVAVPEGAPELPEGLPRRHSYDRVPFSAAGLEGRQGVTFSSMGRGYKDDPVFFDAAASAVALALGGGAS